MTDPEHFHALPTGYRFEDYEIVRVLGHGGFGITYLGFDNNLDKPVAIKEYLPEGLAVRDSTDSVIPMAASLAEDFQWGLDRFLDEARTPRKPVQRHPLSFPESISDIRPTDEPQFCIRLPTSSISSKSGVSTTVSEIDVMPPAR